MWKSEFCGMKWITIGKGGTKGEIDGGTQYGYDIVAAVQFLA
jgi:hypothetical protein